MLDCVVGRRVISTTMYMYIMLHYYHNICMGFVMSLQVSHYLHCCIFFKKLNVNPGHVRHQFIQQSSHSFIHASSHAFSQPSILACIRSSSCSSIRSDVVHQRIQPSAQSSIQISMHPLSHTFMLPSIHPSIHPSVGQLFKATDKVF